MTSRDAATVYAGLKLCHPAKTSKIAAPVSDAIRTRLRKFGPKNCISADNETSVGFTLDSGST